MATKKKVSIENGGAVSMGENEDFSEGYIYVDDNFVAPVKDEDVMRDADGNKLYVTIERKIIDADGRSRNAMRGRKKLLPSMCEICGTEVTRNYSILSESDKAIAKAKVAAHKKVVHYTNQSRVINEKQLNETNRWPRVQ